MLWVPGTQGELNDLWRTRLSRGRKICLLPTPSPVSKVDRRHMHRKTEKERQLSDERGRSGSLGGAKSYECENVRSSIHHSILSAGTSLKVTGVVAGGGGGSWWFT